MRIYRLDNPWGLLFLILPVLCIVILITSRFFLKKGVKITGVSKFEKGISLLTYGYYATTFLTILGMFIVAFSLSKPQYGIKKEKIVSEGIDIIIALDTSTSMLQNDFLSLSRIEGAKDIIAKFVDKRKGDRTGLVTFANNSFLKCPATLNHKILKKIIKYIFIDPTKESANRTAIGIGLASSINRLLNIRDKTKSTSQIIILVTDGENNAGEISPEAATEIAGKSGIKVYTVGIGKKEEVDLELLNNIAEKTGGVFYHARNTGKLGPIFDEINKLEKHKIETMQFTRFKDVGYRYAFLGMLILLGSLLINILFFKRLA